MTIPFVIISFFLAILGTLVWRFKLVDLLANVGKTTSVDRNGLARWSGSCILAMAALTLCEGVVLGFVKTNRAELIVCALFMFTTQMTTVIYLSGLHRYTK